MSMNTKKSGVFVLILMSTVVFVRSLDIILYIFIWKDETKSQTQSAKTR